MMKSISLEDNINKPKTYKNKSKSLPSPTKIKKSKRSLRSNTVIVMDQGIIHSFILFNNFFIRIPIILSKTRCI